MKRAHKLDVADLDLVRHELVPGCENDRPAAHQALERTFDRPGADLWTLQVTQQGDWAADLLSGLPDVRGRLPVRRFVAVREVKTRDVHAGLDHRAEHVRR